MSEPRRIQRKRTRGWRMPEGAVYVGRPTIWGNPFSATSAMEAGYKDGPKMAAWAFGEWVRGNQNWQMGTRLDDRRQRILDAIAELRGHDLACWCPLGRPCHADVLLELANTAPRHHRTGGDDA